MPVILARSISATIALTVLAACASRSDSRPADTAGATRAAAPNDTARIGRVLRGLCPPVEIEGTPAPGRADDALQGAGREQRGHRGRTHRVGPRVRREGSGEVRLRHAEAAGPRD